MGTSSSYGGPKGKNPLLPSDFDANNSDSNNTEDNSPNKDNPNDNPDLSKSNINSTQLWGNVKKQFSSLAKRPSNSKLKSALSSYVKANGGSSKTAIGSNSGRITTRNVGQFFSSVNSSGIYKTFEKYHISYTGKNIEDILGDVINALAPIPNTKEDSIAKNALLDTLESVYKEIIESGEDIESMDNLDSESFNDLMQTYITSYIYQKVLNDLESRFEEYSKSVGSTLKLEEDIKEYINGVVVNVTQDTNFESMDFSSNQTESIISDIYKDCFEVIEKELSNEGN